MEDEAAAAEKVYELADRLPEPARISNAAVSYVRVVVQEWPALELGRSNPRAGELANDLRESVLDFEPGTAAEGEIYSL